MLTVILLTASNIFMTFAWYGQFNAAELKTIQEIITLVVFTVFSIIYLKEELRWNYIVGFLLIIAAAFFIFKKW